MARLTWKQMLIAVALGALFATLQSDPPMRALGKLSSTVTCAIKPASDRC